MLRKNQSDAINRSIENDFSSGIHYHATGTGKSWIAMHLLKEYNKKYMNKNVLWICESKDILKEQFNKKILEKRDFNNILKNYNVYNFVEKKNNEWYNCLNSARYWDKPYLCVINRCYLTTKKKYEYIRNNIDLVIHDECHSIENKSTKEFYDWLLEHNSDCKVIGFSATPELIYPLDNIISSYNIYNGYVDNVILAPKIVWIKCEHEYVELDMVNIIKNELKHLYYKKIIVWCGMIEECIKIGLNWKEYFNDYKVCIDFCNIDSKKYNMFGNYDDFYNSAGNSILFCAVKHREGSDIPNIDGCIFLDKVEKRSKRLFIQSMGRVLRKDSLNKKKYGLVIDIKAKSTIEICNRIQHYLKLENIFPWKYGCRKYKVNKKICYYVNELIMEKREESNNEDNNIKLKLNKDYCKDDVINMFVREIPNNIEYKERLDKEIDMILSKKLFGNIICALDILELTKDIPHITRGSCGSSLVCYLLGISHVDPIENNICFARFLNSYRNNLPDIDFDFPHYLRDEVFLKLYQKYGNKVVRISNHNYYHEKSALRESLRKNGINKFISKYDIYDEIDSYDNELKENIYKTQKELEGTFKGYSLHCGGVIYYPDGVPKEYVLEKRNSSVLNQVVLNKYDVSENKNFKIDILSSCALSQLYYCRRFELIDFNSNIGDEETVNLLCNGDNIGITLAETPLMRKALLLVQPKNVVDLAICLSIIRPAAKDAKKDMENGELDNNIIFDDDAIFLISKLLKCDEEYADKVRRDYCKSDDICSIIKDRLKTLSKREGKKILGILDNLKKYSFCKAHALSYAQLVWQLAYEKTHKPKRFWKSVLKYSNSCYRNWVHIYEARCHDILYENNKNESIYATNKRQSINNVKSKLEQIKRFGYWNMTDDNFYKKCYYIESEDRVYLKGLIASSRNIFFGKSKRLILFVGVDKNKYVEIIVSGKVNYNTKKVLIECNGIKKNSTYNTIETKNKDVIFI